MDWAILGPVCTDWSICPWVLRGCQGALVYTGAVGLAWGTHGCQGSLGRGSTASRPGRRCPQAGAVPRLGLSPLELSRSFPWLPEPAPWPGPQGWGLQTPGLGSPTDLCQGRRVGDRGDTEGRAGWRLFPWGVSRCSCPWHGVPWCGVVWHGTAGGAQREGLLPRIGSGSSSVLVGAFQLPVNFPASLAEKCSTRPGLCVRCLWQRRHCLLCVPRVPAAPWRWAGRAGGWRV